VIRALPSLAQAAATGRRGLDSGLNLLFLATLPMLLWLFRGSLAGVAGALALLATLWLALRLVADGQRRQEAYDAATTARRPRLPRKILGSLLLALVALLLAGQQFAGLAGPMAAGAAALLLSLLAFGPDPLRDKGCPNAAALPRPLSGEAAQAEETAQAMAIEARLSRVVNRLDPLGDADLLRRSEALRLAVTRPLREQIGNPRLFARILALAERLAEILETEARRLHAAQGGSDQRFARRRFVAKLEALAETFEARAAKAVSPACSDAFDVEAQRLLARMPRETAA
jgi:hypothetical protein